MSLTAKMTQRNDLSLNIKNKDDEDNSKLPKIHLVLELDKFNFDIQKEQYDCIIKIINTVSQYHKILYEYNNTTKFKFFRPKIKLSSVLKSQKEDSNQDNKNNNNNNVDNTSTENNKIIDKKKVINDWWRYAIKMIVKEMKYIKNNQKNIFNIPKILIEEYRKDFERLYKKYYLKYNENII